MNGGAVEPGGQLVVASQLGHRPGQPMKTNWVISWASEAFPSRRYATEYTRFV